MHAQHAMHHAVQAGLTLQSNCPARIVQLGCETGSGLSKGAKESAAALMSYLLPHLHTGFAVDQAILSVSLLPIKK